MGAVFSNFDRAHDAQKHKSHNSISTLASSGWRHGNARIFSITRRTPTNVTWASCSFIWSTKIQRLWVFDVYSQRYQCCRVTTTEDSSVPPLALLPHYCYRHASHDFRHTFVAPMNLMSVMQFYLEHKKNTNVCRCSTCIRKDTSVAVPPPPETVPLALFHTTFTRATSHNFRHTFVAPMNLIWVSSS